MPTITLSVPDDFKKKMDAFPEIDWSFVSREAIVDKIEKLELFKLLDKLASKSKLTDEDCIELGERIKEERLEQLKKEGLV